MAREKSEKDDGRGSPLDSEAHLLYTSLEQYNQEQKRRRHPSIILAALLCLFLSSAGGIALAVILVLEPAEVQAACLARDLILVAAGIALLYIILHIRGARKDYTRMVSHRGWQGGMKANPMAGPPQIYGNYLHASALLVARLGIAVWIAALVATAVMIAKAVPFAGFPGKVPFLNLLICVGAIPSFIIISATIERNPTPFATTGLSRNSFLTCRVSDFADELTADMSVSRRASLQRQDSQTGSVLTLPTEEIFHLGATKQDPGHDTEGKGVRTRVREVADHETELMTSSPIRTSHFSTASWKAVVPRSPIPPVPRLPSTTSLPEPVYNPGGWRNEWNNVAEQVGVSRISDETTVGSTNDASTQYSSSCYSSTPASSMGTSASSGSAAKQGKKHRAQASTSIVSINRRSHLSAVRYASKPGVAIRQELTVFKKPAISSTTATTQFSDPPHGTVQRPAPVSMLRNAQRIQKSRNPNLKRKPSNFPRPIPSSKGGAAESGVHVKIPGAFVDDADKT
ncbi:hypothetical protein F4778DRAFT_659776 [Xylariomycetidae sp. FL2044]|nr:hypothetical protein F4778DRAFT_659776 [Xylariomycetidae sp. FL2044]